MQIIPISSITKIYQIQPTIQTDIPIHFMIFPRTKLIYLQQIMKGRLSNLYCNMNLEHSLFSNDCNSDSLILFLAGTPEQVNIKIVNLLKVSSLSEYTALRVQIKGRVLKQQNTCCLMSTIFASAALLLPIFCVCTQWWRRKALKLIQIGQPTYQLISDLLKHNNFQECYILLEDNFLDREKLQTLAYGLRHSVSNFMLINKARKFNISGSNSSNFQANIQAILQDVKYAQVRWEKTVFNNSQIIPRGL